jgi:hypothetical protein
MRARFDTTQICGFSTQDDPQHAAVAAIVHTLQAHPEFTPSVLEFLETLVHEQVAGMI